MGGSLIVNTLFSDFIFIQVVMDLVRIQDLVSKHLLARFASSQHEMNRRYVAPAGIYLAFRMQQAGKYVILAPMFGSAIPILFAIAALYFWLGTWIDRSNLLRRLAPPPPTDESLTRVAALYIFPIGIVLHVIMALIFFAQLTLLSEQEDQAAAAEAGRMLLDNATTMLLNSSSNATELLPPLLPPSPPSIPPLAPPLPTTLPPPPPKSPLAKPLLPDEWLAFWILLVIAGIAICSLTYFVLRECARCRAVKRLRSLMPGEQANTVLRVIAGEATYKHRHTHLSATANLQNGTVAAILEHSDQPNEWKTHSPYLPPLPGPLLRVYKQLQQQLPPPEPIEMTHHDLEEQAAEAPAAAEPEAKVVEPEPTVFMPDNYEQNFDDAEEAATSSSKKKPLPKVGSQEWAAQAATSKKTALAASERTTEAAPSTKKTALAASEAATAKKTALTKSEETTEKYAMSASERADKAAAAGSSRLTAARPMGPAGRRARKGKAVKEEEPQKKTDEKEPSQFL